MSILKIRDENGIFKDIPAIKGDKPIITIGENGNWFVDGVDTGKSSKGTNEVTPDMIQETVNNYLDENGVGLTTKVNQPIINGDASNGTSGQVLITNGDGTTAWIDPPDSGVLDGSITIEKMNESLEPKIYNLIKDANFDGIANSANHQQYNTNGRTADNGVLTITKNATGQFFYRALSPTLDTSHVYFYSVQARLGANATLTEEEGIEINENTVTLSKNWLQVVKTATGGTVKNYCQVSRPQTVATNAGEYEIKNPIIVDLTTLFGAGHEPSADGFKAILDTYYDVDAFKKQLPWNSYFFGNLRDAVNVSLKNYAKNIPLSADATGNGTLKYISWSGRIYPANLGTIKHYACAKVRCNKSCEIRLLNIGSPADSTVESETIAKKNITADEEIYIYGTKNKTIRTSGSDMALSIRAYFGSAEEAEGAVLTVSNVVAVNLTETFGVGNEPDAETIFKMLAVHDNHHFVDDINLFNKLIIATSNHKSLSSEYSDGYVCLTIDKGVEIGGNINPNWEGWTHPQQSYGNAGEKCPVPTRLHGKVETDAQFTAVPLYSHWGRDAVTKGAGDWGGHVFHGWNDAQTYRLTMMASGGMTPGTVQDFHPREDEFCIHVFSPTGAFDNPINITESEAQNRITRESEDIFSGGTYYGRIRIGADKADEGYVFRSKSLTCYGRIDLNGNKLILGTQSVPTSSKAAGVKGQISYDDNYFYVCIAANTWKRFALETW